MRLHALLSTLVLLPALLGTEVDGAKVLFFMGLATHSHRVALQPLVNELAERGHDVTVLSHIKAEDPHPAAKDYFPESLRELFEGAPDTWTPDCVQGRSREKHYDPLVSTYVVYQLSLDLQEACARNPEFQDWVHSSKFDLVFYDSPMKELAVGIAHKMGAKSMVFVTTSTQWMHEFELFGLPAESSWLPDLSHGGSYPYDSFIPDHFMWAYNSLKMYYWFSWHYLPKLDGILEELYGEPLPPLEGLLRKIDLVLLNEHFSFTFPRALPPFVVPVGGMHVKESNGTLSKEIETFLESQSRFVYVSFGSGLKISDLSQETQKMFFDTLGSFKDTNFLLKYNGNDAKNVPQNILLQKWFPQQDVLAHPKCKGFITQVGAMSYQQAIFHGVPIIAVPIWGDQEYLARSAVYHEIGIWLELSTINTETLTSALDELLNSDKYRKNMKEASERFRDRPLPAVQTAAWWTEYVLRHDTAHLKSPGIQQYWWQRRLLDFWLFVLVTMLIALVISFKLIRVLTSRLLRRSNGIQKDKQQ